MAPSTGGGQHLHPWWRHDVEPFPNYWPLLDVEYFFSLNLSGYVFDVAEQHLIMVVFTELPLPLGKMNFFQIILKPFKFCWYTSLTWISSYVRLTHKLKVSCRHYILLWKRLVISMGLCPLCGPGTPYGTIKLVATFPNWSIEFHTVMIYSLGPSDAI